MAAKVLKEHALRLEEQAKEQDRYMINKMFKCKKELKIIKQQNLCEK